jgi:hypothetical protein
VVIKRRQIITVLIGALVACVISHADMVPLSPLDAAECRQSTQANTLTDLGPASPSTPFPVFPGIGDLDSLPVGFLPHSNPAAGPTSATKPAQILADRQNSLTLCLYALFGLGLCRSAPFVKKLHLGCIPDWYHTGGPLQIGHSLVISPDCLCSAPVYCFVQPDGRVEDSISQYRHEIITSLWRKSQFTPAALAARGPPCMS